MSQTLTPEKAVAMMRAAVAAALADSHFAESERTSLERLVEDVGGDAGVR